MHLAEWRVHIFLSFGSIWPKILILVVYYEKIFTHLAVLIVLALIAVLIFLFRNVATKPVANVSDEPVVDAVLIGGGIMSATLGTYLNELEPDWQIHM